MLALQRLRERLAVNKGLPWRKVGCFQMRVEAGLPGKLLMKVEGVGRARVLAHEECECQRLIAQHPCLISLDGCEKLRTPLWANSHLNIRAVDMRARGAKRRRARRRGVEGHLDWQCKRVTLAKCLPHCKVWCAAVSFKPSFAGVFLMKVERVRGSVILTMQESYGIRLISKGVALIVSNRLQKLVSSMRLDTQLHIEAI